MQGDWDPGSEYRSLSQSTKTIFGAGGVRACVRQ